MRNRLVGALRHSFARRGALGRYGSRRRGPGQGRSQGSRSPWLVRLRREPAPRRDLHPGARGAGLRVRRAFGLGPRELVGPAPSRRAGRARARVRRHRGAVPQPGPRDPAADAAATHAALVQALQGTVPQALAPPRRRTPTRSSSARDRRALGLARVSDLGAGSRQLTFGGPPECPTRPLCLEGLARGLRGRRSGSSCRSTPVVASPARRSSRASSTSRCCSPPIRPSTPATWSSWSTTASCSRPRTSRRSCAPRWSTGRGHAGHGARRGVRAVDTETLRSLNARAAATGSIRSTATPLAGRRAAAMTVDDATRATPVDSGRWPAHRPSQPPAAAPLRCATAAAPQHRHDRHAAGSSPRPCCWSCVVAMSFERAGRLVNQVDAAILRQIAGLRTEWLTDVADGIDRVGSGWTITVIAIALLVALVVLRRWRHLFTFLGAIVVIEIIADVIYRWSARPRPYDVTIIGRWDGYSFLAAPVAVVALIVRRDHLHAGVRRSPPADRQVVAAVAVVVCRVAAELYLGDVPSVRRRRRRRGGRRHPRQRLPLLHAQRGVPRHLPSGQDRAPRRRRAAGRGDPPGGPGPARADGGRDQAGRSRRLGWLDAAAAPRRRRPRHLPVREALRDEPRPRRPLVQARPHDPLRPARGRGARSSRCGGWSSTRTTRCG